MAKITFIEFNGTPHEVDAPENMSVMMAAKTNNVPGIDADCGGTCSCATCRVYVDPAWAKKLAEPNTLEAEMLEYGIEDRADARLSCQIKVTPALDGLILRMPKSQR